MRLPDAATRLLAVVLMALAPLPVAAALVSDALAARVAGWQRMIDPLMPALLLLVLMVVAWALVQARRRAHQHAAAGEALAAPFGWRRGLGLGALALGFALLAAAIGGHDTHQRLLQWDAAVVAAAQRGVSPATQQALRWVSDLGDVLVLTPLVLAVAGGVLIGAIVVSRVLLRVHFVSDVVGGLLLAGFTLLLATGLLRPWRPGDGVEWERPWPR